MNLKKTSIYGGILLLVVFGMIFYYQQYMRCEVAFEKYNIAVVKGPYENENYIIWGHSLSYTQEGKGNLTIDKLYNFDSTKKIDPAYEIGEIAPIQEDAYGSLIDINMIGDMEVNYSKIQYTLKNKQYIVDIGKVSVAYQSGPRVKEQTVFKMENENQLQVEVSDVPGNIVKIEAVNKDMDLTFKNIEEKEKNTYSYDIVYKPIKGYDMCITSLKYTVNINGEERVFYGTGEIVITKNGAGGNYVSSSTTQF